MSRSLIGTSNGLVSFTDLSNSVGLRLKNPRFYCFLNTAVNTVVSNEALMAKILNDDTFKVWGKAYFSLMTLILLWGFREVLGMFYIPLTH